MKSKIDKMKVDALNVKMSGAERIRIVFYRIDAGVKVVYDIFEFPTSKIFKFGELVAFIVNSVPICDEIKVLDPDVVM